MRVTLAVVVFASLVQANFDIEEEINKFDDHKNFAHYLGQEKIEEDPIVEECLSVPFDVPEELKFNGSKYILKLLRGVYFYDLKSIGLDPQRKNSVFNRAVATVDQSLEISSLGLFSGVLPQGNQQQKIASEKCDVDDAKIYTLINKKLSQTCVVPQKGEKHFQESDIPSTSKQVKICLTRINFIMDAIIDGFNNILSVNIGDLDLYVDALHLLSALEARELAFRASGPKLVMLRFLLLNELIILKMKSDPDGRSRINSSETKLFIARIKDGLSLNSKEYIDDEVRRRMDLELMFMFYIALQTEIDESKKYEEEKTNKTKASVIKRLFSYFEIKDRNLVI